MNKKFILNAVYFLMTAWCPILAFAQETKVYFTNNTANELEITFNLTHQLIKPYATNAILQITRDGERISGQKDKFIVQINHPNYPNQTILYTLEREGAFLSSHIRNFLQLPILCIEILYEKQNLWSSIFWETFLFGRHVRRPKQEKRCSSKYIEFFN